MIVPGGRCHQGSGLIVHKERTRVDIYCYFGSDPERLNPVFLNHQPRIIVVDMNERFRPVYLRQFHAALNFGILRTGSVIEKNDGQRTPNLYFPAGKDFMWPAN